MDGSDTAPPETRDVGGSEDDELKRLRQSEARFRALVSATSDIVYRLSPDWTVLSQLDRRGAGGGEDVPQIGWQEKILLPDDRPAIMAVAREAIRTRSVYQLEHRVRRLDGSLGWLQSRAVPILDDDGEIVEWFGVATDVTARREAEQALRERFAELEQIYASAPIGLALLDLDLVFLRINERLAAVNGASADAHIGRSVPQMVPVIAEQLEAIRDALVAGEGPIEKIIAGETAAQPGVTRYWNEHWSPVRDAGGELVALSVVVEEITERKRIEDALQESEERLRLAATSADLGTWDVDLSTGSGKWDAVARRLAGLSEQMTESDGVDWLKMVHRDDRERIGAAFQAALEPAGPPYRVEFRGRIPTEDGGERWLISYGIVVRDRSGRALRVVGFLQEITKQKRAEEHRRLLAEELHHRLKNTLGVVQSIARNTFRGDVAMDEAVEAFGDRIAALSAAHSLLMRREWRDADIGEVVRSALAAVPADRVDIIGDPARLRPDAALNLSLVLHELCTNASKYGALSNEAGRLSVSWSVTDDLLEIEWRETGGPAVTPPVSQGFGSRVLQRALANEARAAVDLDYAPGGLVCRIRLSVEVRGMPGP